MGESDSDADDRDTAADAAETGETAETDGGGRCVKSEEAAVRGIKREKGETGADEVALSPSASVKRPKKEKSHAHAAPKSTLLNLADVLRGMKFDRKLRLFVPDKEASEPQMQQKADIHPTPFEEDAIWASGSAVKGVTTLDLECTDTCRV